MRDLARLIGDCAVHGENIGIYAERLLDDPLPWTRMRAVYRLLGLVRRYGPEPVEAACATALDLDVVSVTKIAAMLAKATETTPPTLPAAAGITGGRFARDNTEYLTTRPAMTASATTSTQPHPPLALIPGGLIPSKSERNETP